MKKVFLLLIPLTFSIYSKITAQPCFTNGITFSTQESIDNFQSEYPSCTKIEGDVTISGSDITNLIGLNSLDSIGGDLTIIDNPVLDSLKGLEGIPSLSWNLTIENNAALTSLKGLDSVSSVHRLKIINNDSLTSLSGLDNLNVISLLMTISDNDALTSLNGLNNLSHIPVAYNACGLSISNNASLVNLNGLENLSSVGGSFNISGNSSLISLDGIDSLIYTGHCSSRGGSDTSFRITDNDSLSSLSALANLSNVHGILISDNFSLTDLTGLENLTSAGGPLNIENNENLTSLNGLNFITYIGSSSTSDGAYGGLTIANNPSLTSLNGLESLDTVRCGIYILNNSELTSLGSLINITTTEPCWSWATTYWNITISGNASLTSLSGLDSLNSVKNLNISDNDVLTSLSGLDNIDPLLLYYLQVENNPNLCECYLPNICDYLENQGEASVSGNDLVCQSVAEIEAACLNPVECIVSAKDVHTNRKDAIQIFPNPSNGIIQFIGNNQDYWEITVWTSSGRLMRSQKLTLSNTIDISDLPDGLYFIQLKNGNQVAVKKVIKEE